MTMEKQGGLDWGVLLVSLLMLGFGIVLVFSSSFPVAEQRFGGADFFLSRHLLRAAVGIVCLFVFMNLDYHFIGKYSGFAYLAAIVMLVYVLLLPDSHAVNGAKRWIDLGFVRFQVSEFARIVLIVSLAAHCERIGDDIRQNKGLAALLLKIGLVALLIVVEPDFSTAVLTSLVGLAIIFMSGARVLHLVGLGLAALPVIVIAVLSMPYRRQRLIGFLNMADHSGDLNYQVHQSLIGLGHGGILGVGLGQGTQKFFYLPEPHTDFIFSILGEEIGFVGLLVILGLFSFLVYRGASIALRAPDKQGRLIAFGLTFVLAMYVILHTFVNTGLVPTTGVPLPFLSYGGMSLVFTMCGMGMLLNISTQAVHTAAPGKGTSASARSARKKR